MRYIASRAWTESAHGACPIRLAFELAPRFAQSGDSYRACQRRSDQLQPCGCSTLPNLPPPLAGGGGPPARAPADASTWRLSGHHAFGHGELYRFCRCRGSMLLLIRKRGPGAQRPSGCKLASWVAMGQSTACGRLKRLPAAHVGWRCAAFCPPKLCSLHYRFSMGAGSDCGGQRPVRRRAGGGLWSAGGKRGGRRRLVPCPRPALA